MKIYEIAKNIEKEGEQFYRGLAEKTNDPGLKSILNMMAEDEVKHYRIFERLEQKEDAPMEDTFVLRNAKAIFEQMRGAYEGFDSDTPQDDVYSKAIESENETLKVYEDILEQAETEQQKEVIRKIMEEEKKHAYLLENMRDFLRRPTQWLEDAEYRHLEQY